MTENYYVLVKSCHRNRSRSILASGGKKKKKKIALSLSPYIRRRKQRSSFRLLEANFWAVTAVGSRGTPIVYRCAPYSRTAVQQQQQ